MTIEEKREYERNWYKTSGKEKRMIANKRWEDKQVLLYKELKSSLKCEQCGENHIACLEFHHNDPSTKEVNIGTAASRWSVKRLQSEIDKCTVLCANCHRKLHNPL